ncbi:hypothetical protein G6F22_021619 [Rhizopus arrhizus]|nr:hypothetical protein G6F22_021619 [Rhizopus arrhizus]
MERHETLSAGGQPTRVQHGAGNRAAHAIGEKVHGAAWPHGLEHGGQKLVMVHPAHVAQRQSANRRIDAVKFGV